MTTNEQIAAAFDEVADILEFQQANPFRVRAYRHGARTIQGLTESLSVLVEQDADLTKIGGIGKDLAEKITTMVRTGELPQLSELRAKIPASVLQLMNVPGLGPKKAAVLHRELSISNLEELRAACKADQVSQIKGFGEKTQQKILKGIDLAIAANERLLWADADQLAQALRQHLQSCTAIDQLELAGSYRRGKETVGDLDILVVATDADQVMDHFGKFAEVTDVLVRGETKMSVRLQDGFQVDLRVVPGQSFGAALQYFTGSKEHNVILRGRAKQLGLKVNEYGVYRLGEDSDAEGEYVAGATEQDVYAALDLPWITPELREGRQEYDWADSGSLPELVEIDDLRGDLHMHTTATDGKASIREMIAAAQARGLRYIAITDHSQRVAVAGGLNSQQVLAQWEEIDQIRQELDADFSLLKGIECDILESGQMDLPDDVLAQADWVIASVHFGHQQSRQQITDRIVGALQHPAVCVVAHPTGRLINRRERYDVDLDAVYAAAKEHGKFLELNANPRRLDLDDIHCAAAKKHGVPIVICSDAHSTRGLDVLRYGILQARRAGLTKADVANTRSWKQIKKLLGRA